MRGSKDGRTETKKTNKSSNFSMVSLDTFSSFDCQSYKVITVGK